MRLLKLNHPEAVEYLKAQESESEYAQLSSLAEQNGMSKAAVLRLGLRQIIVASTVTNDEEYMRFPSVRLINIPEAET